MRPRRERRHLGADPGPGALVRGARRVLLAASAGVLVALVLPGPVGPAGAQEICLIDNVPVLCDSTTTAPTEPPATTTTRAPTTTTEPPATTTDPPATTTQPPATDEPTTTTRPGATTTTRAPRITTTGPPATVAQGVDTTPTTAAPATDSTTADSTTPASDTTTAAPTTPASDTTATTEAPTTFFVVTTKPEGENVTPIGFNQPVAATPAESAGRSTAEMALALGAVAAVGLVIVVAWRERHRPEAD
jgi:hypothetical protein